ncbi:hypothetical protein DFP72DRAFT_860596 [Ephemerocybe angulata]|uniref:Uncharacterized protein n=1 Tax=Ephemerocybe angulata TaxID=980116 RepID=A0A8H6H9Y3_9AGAR|nr:hypothetical protein DFP72DRAFT_860596 [Tulosesus angulatus]
MFPRQTLLGDVESGHGGLEQGEASQERRRGVGVVVGVAESLGSRQWSGTMVPCAITLRVLWAGEGDRDAEARLKDGCDIAGAAGTMWGELQLVEVALLHVASVFRATSVGRSAGVGGQVRRCSWRKSRGGQASFAVVIIVVLEVSPLDEGWVLCPATCECLDSLCMSTITPAWHRIWSAVREVVQHMDGVMHGWWRGQGVAGGGWCRCGLVAFGLGSVVGRWDSRDGMFA